VLHMGFELRFGNVAALAVLEVPDHFSGSWENLLATRARDLLFGWVSLWQS